MWLAYAVNYRKGVFLSRRSSNCKLPSEKVQMQSIKNETIRRLNNALKK